MKPLAGRSGARPLDAAPTLGKLTRAMRNPLPLAAVAVSLLALAACNTQKEPKVVDTTEDPLGNAVQNAKPVELPPAISATVEFRCKDNTLVTVDFFKGNTQLTLHPTKDGIPVHLVAATAGGPYTAAGGYTLSGDEKKITWKDAEKPEQTCHV